MTQITSREGPHLLNLISCLITLNNDDTFSCVWTQIVCGDASVLSGVSGLSIDNLDRDHAVCVGDRVLGRIKFFASLQPFDLENNEFIIIIFVE